MADRTISTAVERQMRNWELARQQQVAQPEPEARTVHEFVTVSRVSGSGGAEVAQGVAEQTGWPVFDKEILHFMSGDDDVRKRLYETMDERDVGFVEEALREFTSTEFKRNDYFHRLTETILALARKGNAIFVGRGADLLLPRHIGLRIRVENLPAVCAERYATAHDLNQVEAAREIELREQDGAKFIRNHFSVDPHSRDRFDLTINLASLSVDEAVHLVVEMMRLRGMIE